jgi:hypothetical protein
MLTFATNWCHQKASFHMAQEQEIQTIVIPYKKMQSPAAACTTTGLCSFWL